MALVAKEWSLRLEIQEQSNAILNLVSESTLRCVHENVLIMIEGNNYLGPKEF